MGSSQMRRSTLMRCFSRYSLFGMATLVLFTAGARRDFGADTLIVTSSITLDPAKVYGSIVVKSSNVTIDGAGAWLIGARGGPAKNFSGTAIVADHVSNVTIKNLNAKGWESGLHVKDGSGWVIENCNFSDNFHDPAFGWGENGRRGGIVLERVFDSVLRRNKANRVWDACVLVESNRNRIESNDFSHTSNTCLKLWDASNNRVQGNILSHGLRIDPGEVHARDSACVLIESGSDHNQFVGNDCTHGGDGIFIRVLNGRVSSGNVFEENDVSYANNNGFEAWAPRNVYRRNRADHCSYGFWLGSSDQTRLEGNHASFNGDPKGFHNSPHILGNGHAGIVFMFGPSSHTVVRGNVCEGNYGAGLALLGDLETAGRKWKAFHWIVEQNKLLKNRWGLFAEHADWVDVAGNEFEGNSEGDYHLQDDVSRFTKHPNVPGVIAPPSVRLEGPTVVHLGEKVTFNASATVDPQSRPLAFAWDLGDRTLSDQAVVNHVFTNPGFHRLGLTVNNGSLSEMAWRDLYVVDDVAETGTEGQAKEWSWVDPASRVEFSDDSVRICGQSSILARVAPYGGGRVGLLYPRAKASAWPLRSRSRLVFWIRSVNENLPAWQEANPVITLFESAGRSVTLTPKTDLMSNPPNNEEREGWTRFLVPLAGDAQWTRQGPEIATVNYLTIGFDSWGGAPWRVSIDGLFLE